MEDEQTAEQQELAHASVGERLRHAREEQRLSVAHVAAETRIPIRHLEAIEAGRFSSLPARTYAIGFSRSYARLLGLNEEEIAEAVRYELALADPRESALGNSMEPGDSAKLPSSGLAWFGAIAGLLLVTGLIAFYSTHYAAGTGPAALIDDRESDVAANDEVPAEPQAPNIAAISADGQVVFTALEDGVWVRFYDVDGVRLLEKQMSSGERFEIPMDAQEPRINTGRPDAFAITIGGRTVPKLADEPITIGDALVSASALLARAEPPVASPVEQPSSAFN